MIVCPVTKQQSSLLIGGKRHGREGRDIRPVVNPATGKVVGEVPVGTAADLDEGLDSAAAAFPAWRDTPAYDRYGILRKAGELLRERAGDISHATTMEQGKPLGESTPQAYAAADILDWFAEASPGQPRHLNSPDLGSTTAVREARCQHRSPAR
jgi:succinate-semialdehyde dehydrogenase / glutarate-semialdehyde dehydrogenase